jgi:hypothetical protein
LNIVNIVYVPGVGGNPGNIVLYWQLPDGTEVCTTLPVGPCGSKPGSLPNVIPTPYLQPAPPPPCCSPGVSFNLYAIGNGCTMSVEMSWAGGGAGGSAWVGTGESPGDPAGYAVQWIVECVAGLWFIYWGSAAGSASLILGLLGTSGGYVPFGGLSGSSTGFGVGSTIGPVGGATTTVNFVLGNSPC